MPPTKQCPDCKVAVHIRQKVCDRCHHVFRSKRIAEYKANEKSIKRARASESDSMKSVLVSPGMGHNQKIPFRGKADEIPDGDAGDVIVILQEEEHSLFKRSGLDLMMEKTLTLSEALCGCEFSVKHLDGQQLLIKTKPGRVIPPDSIKGVRDYGMPDTRHTSLKGNLYIKFKIQFPESGFLPTEEERDRLASLFPRRKQVNPSQDAEEVDMIDYEGTKGGGEGGERRGEAYDDYSDDEDSAGARGGHSHMGCSQQ